MQAREQRLKCNQARRPNVTTGALRLETQPRIPGINRRLARPASPGPTVSFCKSDQRGDQIESRNLTRSAQPYSAWNHSAVPQLWYATPLASDRASVRCQVLARESRALSLSTKGPALMRPAVQEVVCPSDPMTTNFVEFERSEPSDQVSRARLVADCLIAASPLSVWRDSSHL